MRGGAGGGGGAAQGGRGWGSWVDRYAVAVGDDLGSTYERFGTSLDGLDVLLPIVSGLCGIYR